MQRTREITGSVQSKPTTERAALREKGREKYRKGKGREGKITENNKRSAG